jgi:hypothetical protein
MQLRFAHRAFESEKQAVVEVVGIIETILVQDQCIRKCAKFQQMMPILAVSRKTRHLKPKHDPHPPKAHLSNQPLEAFPIHCGSPGQAQVGVDYMNLFDRPTQCYCPLP